MGEALPSVPLCNGGGVTGRVFEGVTQPEEAASCRNTSRLTGSAGRLSKG